MSDPTEREPNETREPPRADPGADPGAEPGGEPGGFDPSATMVFPRAALPRAAAGIGDAWPIRVEVVCGPMDGLRRRRHGSPFTIGRGTQNDLPLPADPMVSTRHARILQSGKSYWLEDLESRNGTFLGEERIEGRVPIGPGTTFTVGRTLVEFMPR